MTDTTQEDISPFKALDYIRDNAKAYAQAKANVVYMTEYRKTIKATLMATCSEKNGVSKRVIRLLSP